MQCPVCKMTRPCWRSDCICTEEKLATYVAELERKVAEAEAENERLREALVEYGHHSEDCTFGTMEDGKWVSKCSCGFSVALAGKEE